MSTVEERPLTETAESDRTTPPAVINGDHVPSRPEHGWPSEDFALAARFVDQLIRDALETRRRRDPSAPDPVVDWQSLWATGRGSTSIEEGVGRLVVEAEALARDIAEGRATQASPVPIAVVPSAATGSQSVSVAPRDASGPVGVALAPLPSPIDPPDIGREPASGSAPSVAAVPSRRRERLATAFGWIRNVGFALVLFAAWQLWGTSLAQHQSQQALGQQFATHVHQTTTPSSGPVLIAADTRLPEPREGSVVARIRIPTIGVDQYVVEGIAENDLQEGPGHYIGTAMPGQAGNVAIAGHRTTYGAPFNDLNSLAPGDDIDLTTDSGMTFHYVVTQAPVAVAPTDVQVLDAFGDNRLTLTTCNPRYSASQRLVVVALLKSPVGSGVAPNPTRAVPTRSPPRHLANGGSVGWNLSYLPGVLAVLTFIALLSLANRRAALYFGRRGRWLILVPIWLASIYVLFGLLSNFVPSTL
jgi:sortase A